MPEHHPVDYDSLSPTYNRRYQKPDTEPVGDALVVLASSLGADRILEVGCGTGHWLVRLNAVTAPVHGLDASVGMLREARTREASLALVQGTAGRLPYTAGAFDLVYCVNALHHFPDPRAFLAEAYRLLHPGGAVACAGSDPHGHRDGSYTYQYFDGTYATDLTRFASWATILSWMRAAGFVELDSRVAVRIRDPKIGEHVFADPFIEKSACSQLALLTDQAYAEGLARIRRAIADAKARGEEIVFATDLKLALLTGRKPR